MAGAGAVGRQGQCRFQIDYRFVCLTGRKPAQLAAAQSDFAPDGSYHSSELDADLAALTPELRAEYGIGDEVDGVLILDAELGRAVEQGLRSGDVVKKVGQTSVTSPQEVDSLVQEAKSDEQLAVLFLVSRQGQDLYLGLKLDIA